MLLQQTITQETHTNMSRFSNISILNNVDSGDSTMMQNKSIYIHSQWGAPPNNYLHMKTNLNAVNFMWMFEAVGYDYCQATTIRTAWVVHKSGGTLYHKGQVSINSGPFGANNTYMSGDGYLVVVAYMPGCWQGFTLNAYNTLPGYSQSVGTDGVVAITATAFSGGNTGVY
jgi:hypothetical protein